jgi:flagellar biogenesis protein FliO
MFVLWSFGCILPALCCNGFADDRGSTLDQSAWSAPTAEKLSYDPPLWPEAPDTTSLLLRLATGTVTVLMLCVLTLVVGRRWLRGPAPKTAAGSQLQLMESVSLGNRCCVFLLRAGQHQIVVGIDGSGMKSVIALPESFEKSLADAETDTAHEARVTADQLVGAGA